MLRNYLFGGDKFTTIADPNKHKYSGSVIVFDLSESLLLSDGIGSDKNIIYGADMSSYVHNDNKKKAILILGKSPTEGFYNTTLTAEKEYSINFTEKQEIYLVLKFVNLKQKILKLMQQLHYIWVVFERFLS